jgi:hypothetical protein
MERWLNDPERGKRGIEERKPILFCIIYKDSVYTSHRTLISIRKNKWQMLYVGNRRCFCENHTKYTKYSMCR